MGRPDAATACAVTGLGLVTPVGGTPDDVLARVLWGPPGTARITRFDPGGSGCRIGAEIREVPPISTPEAEPISRGTAFLLAAVQRALDDAGMDPSIRLALCLGGGMGDWESVAPGEIDSVLSAPTSLQRTLGLLGSRLAPGAQHVGLYAASASGAQAVAEGKWLIEDGEAEAVLVAGYSAALNPVTLEIFDRLALLSHANHDPGGASRPFDAERDGFVLGEGAGALVLESAAHAQARRVRIHGWLRGVGVTNGVPPAVDAPAEPRGAVTAMSTALADAQLAAGAIDHVLAYGASSRAYDALETRALKAVFGARARHLTVSSTKGVLGYLAEASGIVDLIVGLSALGKAVVPPTLTYAHPDPECDLDYVPRVPRRRRLSTILCNSFGLGAQYVSLVVGAAA
jgi:3-oxoacyl-[acyl-carrier-protein] synthase II